MTKTKLVKISLQNAQNHLAPTKMPQKTPVPFPKYNLQSFNLQLQKLVQSLSKRPYSGPMSKHPETDFSDDSLADLGPGANTPIDIELSSDIFPTIRREGALETDVGDMVAFKTALDYIFAGPAEDLNLN